MDLERMSDPRFMLRRINGTSATSASDECDCAVLSPQLALCGTWTKHCHSVGKQENGERSVSP